MNRSDLDWGYIRRYTVLPVATAIVAGLALFAGTWVHGEQQELYAQISVNQRVAVR